MQITTSIKTILVILPVLVIATAPGLALAQGSTWGTFEAPLPGLKGQTIDDYIQQQNPLTEYMALIVNIATGAIVIIGVIMVIVGGYIYMTAGGSAQRVATAKTFIGMALLGIVLAIATVLILNTINPNLGTDLRDPILPNK